MAADLRIAVWLLALSMLVWGPAYGSAGPAAPSAQWGLGTLLAEIARQAPQRARFVERHFLEVLDEPLDAAGELWWTAPDRLEKRTLQPRSERLSYERGVLRIERDGMQRSVEISAVPEAAALIESLRATLAGDLAGLERVFDARLQGAAEQWTLTLLPRDPAAARLLQSIRLSGRFGAIDTVEVRQTAGDRSVMRILHGR
jgi:hypothetical protein